MSRAKDLLERARAHDDALFYCDKCGNRYYTDSEGDVHDRTSEECRPGGCGAPEDHHPFVEGPLPSYEEAAVDRRNLLRVVLLDYEAAVDALERLVAMFAGNVVGNALVMHASDCMTEAEGLIDGTISCTCGADGPLADAETALARLRDEVPA